MGENESRFVAGEEQRRPSYMKAQEADEVGRIAASLPVLQGSRLPDTRAPLRFALVWLTVVACGLTTLAFWQTARSWWIYQTALHTPFFGSVAFVACLLFWGMAAWMWHLRSVYKKALTASAEDEAGSEKG